MGVDVRPTRLGVERNALTDSNLAQEADKLFEMTHLYPRRTGLPMTIWAGPRGRARHTARIKVKMAHGPRRDIGNTAVVRLKPVPKIIEGELSRDDRQAVFEWIAINEAALIDHWNGKIDGGDLIERLQPLPTTLGGTGEVSPTGAIQTATPPKKF